MQPLHSRRDAMLREQCARPGVETSGSLPATGAVMLRLAMVAVLASAQLALGCARHLDVIDLGRTSSPTTHLQVDVQPTGQPRPDGLFVEILKDGELVTRFTTQPDGPVEILDLPPGEYEVVLDGRPMGVGFLSEAFEIAPGQSLAIVYDDNEAARRAFRDTVVAVGMVVLVVAVVLVEAALVCACGGHYHVHWHAYGGR